MANRFKLSPEQYDQIESKIDLTGDEDYAVILQRRHGKATYGVHVFSRLPTTQELVKYEETASRIKYKGNRAELEGSVLMAGKAMYNTLIARAYDVQVGRKVLAQLGREDAQKVVPDLTKREAIREFLGNVSGLTALSSDDDNEEIVELTEE